MRTCLRRASAMSALLSAGAVVAACSGSGGNSPPPPPLTNLAPNITSSAAVSIDENSSGILYTLVATDPDGDTLAVSVIAGGDEGQFTIDTAAGTISASAALDFENPADGNGDNVYTVTLEVGDPGGLTAQITVSITVRDVVEGMALNRVGTGFSQPLYLEGLPGSSNVIVLQKGGRIRILNPDTGAIDSTDFLNVGGTISTSGEGGLLGIAFSPSFASDRTFYLHVNNTSGDTEIRSYQMMTGSSTQGDPSTADVILTFAQPTVNHNAGWIGFSNDNMLFMPTGDGGVQGDPGGLAQNPNNILGKILRIDVSGDDFPADPDRDYAIPGGNAFPGGAGGLPEIFAVGVRNPWRSSFDRVTGDLFIGDVGQAAREEVNRLRPGDSGTNFGWAQQEGTIDHNGGSDQPQFIDPVAEYAAGTSPTQGRSITGGYVHRGNVQPIKDHYVFADFVSDNVWSVPVADLTVGQTVAADQFVRLNPSLVPNAGALTSIASFGEDIAGNLYIVSLGGDIFRIESAP